MRIGLDGIPLRELKTGVGHYTLELARALAARAPGDEFELVSPFDFLPSNTGEGETSSTPNLRFVHSEENLIGRRWWSVGLPRYCASAGLDLFHGTNYEIPLRGRCPSVLTIHDLSLLLHPETHKAVRVVRARIKLPLMSRRACRIITPTESVRREVHEHLGIEPERTIVIPEAPRTLFRPLQTQDTMETRKRLGVEDDFLLSVGTIEPRKNLRTLLRAFEEVLTRSRHRPQLVVVGREGWKTRGWKSASEKSVALGRVLRTGYISDHDLCALYSSCSAFIYPSLYEGFGLPPLEAMACGAPVIASNIQSLAETTGGAAHLVEPTNAEALARAIIRLLEEGGEREHLSAAGLKRAREFSWERTAELTREVYVDALKRKR